jgi:hypothetical protein
MKIKPIFSNKAGEFVNIRFRAIGIIENILVFKG